MRLNKIARYKRLEKQDEHLTGKIGQTPLMG